MGAPEKIYMTPSFGEPDNVLLASFSKSHLDYHRDIEYTRTEAFINKATDWLEGHIYEYLKMNRTWNEPDYDPKLIGDFIGYMKGE